MLLQDLFEMATPSTAHKANAGEINFKEAWRIDKVKIKDLKKDGSNFFEIAEKVK